MLRFLAAAVAVFAPAANVWTVRVEEPTGLYRRVDELIAVPVDRPGGNLSGFRVVDPAGPSCPGR